MARTPDLAHIFRTYGPAYRQAHRLPLHQLRAMWAIEHCRTAALGGHLEACDHCDHQRLAYHSCRNRHCPQCQTLNKERWLEARRRELLPIRYFHLVFTLPQQLRHLAQWNQQVVYDILFRAASEALLELGRDKLGAQLGAIMLLHTWSQTLIDHPHVHAIVTGGGLSLDGTRWIGSRPNFLVSVRALSQLFRGKCLAALREAFDQGRLDVPGADATLEPAAAFTAFLAPLHRRRWVVYAKPAFGAAEHVLDYLGRYTHRVAISNDRIRRVQNGRVTFTYRDRQDRNRRKRMTLAADEFIRRFLLQVLPAGFVKIRHYGLLRPARTPQPHGPARPQSGTAPRPGAAAHRANALVRAAGPAYRP